MISLGLRSLFERGFYMKKDNKEQGSIELIVLGLLAALIVVLAIPALRSMGTVTQNQLEYMASEMATPPPATP